MKTIRELKQGEMFTLKPIEEEPKENQIWIRAHYDRGSKTFSAYNYADVNKERFFKPTKNIYEL